MRSLIRSKPIRKKRLALLKKARGKAGPMCPTCCKPLGSGRLITIKYSAPNAPFLSGATHCTRAGCLEAGRESRAASSVAYHDAQAARLKARREAQPRKTPQPTKKVRSLSRKAPKRVGSKPRRLVR